jgi:uncharacterized protein with von Willebrand factor type A (vWA) domain
MKESNGTPPSMSAEPAGGGKLLHNLMLFGRLLRGVGLDVNPGRMIDVVQALEYTNVGSKRDFYYTLRSLLVHKKEELPLFDEAFARFWRRPGVELSMQDLMRAQSAPDQKTKVVPASLTPPPDEGDIPPDDDEEPETIIEVTRTYSAQEILRQKDFSELSADELSAIKQLMTQLVWHMGQRRTRRHRSGDGYQLDMRRNIRRSFR